MQQKYFLGFNAGEFQNWLSEFLFSPKAQLFLNNQDLDFMLLILPKLVGDQQNQKYLHNYHFVSLDGGITFLQTNLSFFGGSAVEYTCQLEEPVCGLTYYFVLSSDYVAIYQGSEDVSLNKKRQNLQPLTRSPFEGGWGSSFSPLPEVRLPIHVVKLSDGRYVYVDTVKYNANERSIRFFIGTVEAMHEARINSFDYFLDGGSTYIDTAVGRFFAPVGEDPAWLDNNPQVDKELVWGDSTQDKIAGKNLADITTAKAKAFIASLHLIPLSEKS